MKGLLYQEYVICRYTTFKKIHRNGFLRTGGVKSSSTKRKRNVLFMHVTETDRQTFGVCDNFKTIYASSSPKLDPDVFPGFGNLVSRFAHFPSRFFVRLFGGCPLFFRFE